MKDGKVYKGVRKPTSFSETCWCMVYGMAYVYINAILNGLDWFGQKLVDLIDHSDFFAGAVWTFRTHILPRKGKDGKRLY